MTRIEVYFVFALIVQFYFYNKFTFLSTSTIRHQIWSFRTKRNSLLRFFHSIFHRICVVLFHSKVCYWDNQLDRSSFANYLEWKFIDSSKTNIKSMRHIGTLKIWVSRKRRSTSIKNISKIFHYFSRDLGFNSSMKDLKFRFFKCFGHLWVEIYF